MNQYSVEHNVTQTRPTLRWFTQFSWAQPWCCCYNGSVFGTALLFFYVEERCETSSFLFTIDDWPKCPSVFFTTAFQSWIIFVRAIIQTPANCMYNHPIIFVWFILLTTEKVEFHRGRLLNLCFSDAKGSRGKFPYTRNLNLVWRHPFASIIEPRVANTWDHKENLAQGIILYHSEPNRPKSNSLLCRKQLHWTIHNPSFQLLNRL